MKFDMVARFHETIPTVKSLSSSRSRKILDFDRNYHFALFQKIGFSQGFTHETGHVDIQVEICMIYLNVCAVVIA